MKKNKDLIVKIITYGAVAIAFAIYILADYLTIKAKGGFITDLGYWSGVIIAAVLFSGVMIVVRSMRKIDNIKGNDEIQSIYKQIKKAYKVIQNNGYGERLEQYIKEANEQEKYEQFLRNCDNVIYSTKNDETRKKYMELRKLPREDVLKRKIQFKKINFTGLFAGIDGKIVNDNENDISTHETADVGGMVGKKTFCLILFTAFTGTLAPDFFTVGITAIYTTLLKIFSMCIAVATAIGTADNFVSNNVLIALQRRYNHIAKFVNKNSDIMGKLKEQKVDISLREESPNK